MSFSDGTLINRAILQSIAGVVDFNARALLDIITEALPSIEDLIDEAITEILTVPEVTIGGVDDLLGDFESGILGSIDENINQSFGSLNTFIDTVGNATGGIIEQAGDVIGNAGSRVAGALGNLTGSVGRQLEALLQRLFRAIENAVNAAVSTISEAANSAFRAIGDGIRAATDRLGDLINKLGSSIDGLLNRIPDIVGQAIGKIREFVEPALEAIGNLVSEAEEKITGFAGDFLEQAGDAFESFNQRASDFIEETFTAVNSAFSGLQEALMSFPVALGNFQDFLAEQGQNIFVEPIASALQEIGSIIFRGFQEGFDAELRGSLPSLEETLERAGIPRDIGARLDRVLDQTFEGSPVQGFFANALLWVGVVTATTQAIAAVPSQIVQQQVGVEIPFAIPSESDLRTLTLRNLVTDEDARFALRRAGFSEENANNILALRRQLPDVGVVQIWFLREFISDADARALFRQQGFDEADAQRLLDMSFFIPPVQDLITMAVREVFSPDVAERFGQFEDFPEDFAEFARQQGVSREWAERYWAAHWALPSVQMGFEMFHRRQPGSDEKIISREELEGLLRAQDVMPFWRERLTQIAFRPLTRVDIRRMHGLGLISDEEMQKRYEDLGFAPEDAELMRDFTIAFNSDEEPDAGSTPSELVRDNIKSLFAQGVIQRERAIELLEAEGFTTPTANVILSDIETRQEIEDRQEQTQNILDLAEAGVLTFAEAQDRLHQLGLEVTEIQRAIDKLVRARERATKLPEKSDLDAMLKKGIIDQDTYIETLQRLGFSAFWADKLRRLV